MFVSLHAGQAPAAADKPKDLKCSIEGRVVNSVTGEAVKRGSLTLTLSGATSTAGVVTAESDDSGQFAFLDVKPGPYTLVASRSGFATQAYGERRNPKNGIPLILSAGQQMKGLLFKLAPDAVISGRLVDSEGEPLGGVTVVALRSVYQRGERQWRSRESSVRTNDLGEFRMVGLAAGSYLVVAPPPMTVSSIMGTDAKSSSDEPKLDFVLTYYPNALDTAGAVPVQVEVGGEAIIGDIRRLKVATVRVSGKVVGSAEGKQGVVSLASEDQGELGAKTAMAQSDGSFVMKGVAPGSYVLRGFSLGFFGSQPVQVGERNVEGLILQIGTGSELAGVVTLEGGNKANLEKVRILLQSQDFAGPSASTGPPDKDGKFTLKRVAATRYLVQVDNAPEGFFVKSVKLNNLEVAEEGINLTGGVFGPLQITLSPEAAQVDGVVQDSENKPVTGATVVLVPDSRRFSAYREEQTDQSGKFSLKGVAPGDYKLLAWEDIETGASQDPEFLKKYESKAESLSLKPSDRRTIQVKAIPFEKLP
jgi:hypothetical protein